MTFIRAQALAHPQEISDKSVSDAEIAIKEYIGNIKV